MKKIKILYGTYEYILNNGLNKLTLNGLIKYLKVSKGSFYHHFNSKDQLLYELFQSLVKEHIDLQREKLKSKKSFHDKIHILFEVYLMDTKENKDFLHFYKEVILHKQDKETLAHYSNDFLNLYNILLEDIINEAIEKKEIKKEAYIVLKNLWAIADGMLIYDYCYDEYILSNELNKYIESILELITLKDK